MSQTINLLTLFVLAVGLSMDDFAVAICKGLAMRQLTWGKALIVGAWFGVFQGMMPFIGYILGAQFEQYVTAIAPWIAFVLLGLIGFNMIREAFSGEEEAEEESATLGVTEMFLIICVTTCVLSMGGVKVGNVFGARYKSKAELAGGIILILLGLKILLEHFGVL